MKNEQVHISGLTGIDYSPCCSPDYPCRELCETDRLEIPLPKPDMEDIIEVSASMLINSFNVLSTSRDEKIIVEGTKQIKVLYTANSCMQNVHCSKFNIPFFTFILVRNGSEGILCIETAVEHVSVHQLSCRDLIVSSIILLYPVFKKNKNFSCFDEKDSEFKYDNDCESFKYNDWKFKQDEAISNRDHDFDKKNYNMSRFTDRFGYDDSFTNENTGDCRSDKEMYQPYTDYSSNRAHYHRDYKAENGRYHTEYKKGEARYYKDDSHSRKKNNTVK